MGGVAGHMDHLYDNPNLSFGKLKDILDKASNGELKTEEKVDGQNLFLSYSIPEGKAKGARNKGNLKNGGLDARELATKFAGRGTLTKVFEDGFSAFEKAIEPLSDEEKLKIFGPDTNIWYNAEIMYPGTKGDPNDPGHINIINYDNKILKIHNVGHFWYDPSTGKQTPIPEGSLEILDSAYDRMQDSLNDNKFSLAREAIIQLEKLEDDEALTQAMRRINREMRTEELSDQSTIQDYVKSRLLTGLSEDLTPGLKQELANYLTKSPENIGLRAIKKGLTREQLALVADIVNSKDSILRQAIQPIEMAIHDFSVELLKSAQSAFIADSAEEVGRLQTELSKAVKQITNVGAENPEAMSILQHHLNKIKDFSNISTPIEGVIFDYDGHTYKFVGNFAPLNQILGMFRYGNLKQKTTTENVSYTGNLLNEQKNKRTALLPGGFKPPHAGHYGLAKLLADQPDIDEVIVIIGKKPRTAEGNPEIQISADQSQDIWELYTKNDNNIKIRIQEGVTPVGDVYDLVANNSVFSAGDTVVLGKSDKDVGDKRYAGAPAWADKNNPGVKVEEMVFPQIGGEEMGGTALRNLIASGDKDSFLSKLPEHLTSSEKENAWDIVSSTNESLNNLIDATLDEISSMSGASVHGYMKGPGFGPPNNFDVFRKRKSTNGRRPVVKRAKRQRRR